MPSIINSSEESNTVCICGAVQTNLNTFNMTIWNFCFFVPQSKQTSTTGDEQQTDSRIISQWNSLYMLLSVSVMYEYVVLFIKITALHTFILFIAHHLIHSCCSLKQVFAGIKYICLDLLVQISCHLFCICLCICYLVLFQINCICGDLPGASCLNVFVKHCICPSFPSASCQWDCCYA